MFINLRYIAAAIALVLLWHYYGEEIFLSLDPFGKYNKSLLIIEGDKSRGSGFLGNYKGRTLIFTNAHVIGDNSRISMRSVAGKPLEPKQMAIGKGFDVAVFTQTESAQGLPIAAKVEDIATIGDDVVVVGNSLGAGVFTDLRGKITGIGPDFIEVDAKFVQGNSGSPVIHVKSGMVIGIATLAIYRELKTVGKDSRFNSVERRFAQRIDTIPSFEPTTAAAFLAESLAVERVKKHTETFLHIGSLKADPSWDPNDHLVQLIRDFSRDVANVRSRNDRVSMSQRFARDLVFETKADILQLRTDNYTTYHRKILEDEIVLRTQMRTVLEQVFNIRTGNL